MENHFHSQAHDHDSAATREPIEIHSHSKFQTSKSLPASLPGGTLTKPGLAPPGKGAAGMCNKDVASSNTANTSMTLRNAHSHALPASSCDCQPRARLEKHRRMESRAAWPGACRCRNTHSHAWLHQTCLCMRGQGNPFMRNLSGVCGG